MTDPYLKGIMEKIVIVKKGYGMECPKCKCDNAIHIDASETIKLTPEGAVTISGGYEWEQNSFTYCANCEYEGVAADFRTSD